MEEELGNKEQEETYDFHNETWQGIKESDNELLEENNNGDEIRSRLLLRKKKAKKVIRSPKASKSLLHLSEPGRLYHM